MTALPGPQPAQPGRPDPGVELLERALAYTRGALITVTPGHLHLPTPCDAWSLADLLAHMEDGLDAFGEGAGGTIGLRPASTAPLPDLIESLQVKACGLLGDWAASQTSVVDVGGHPVAVETITRLAALEISIHGWDVARTTGHDAAVPDELAEALLPTALAVALEQTDEFDPPVPVSADAAASRRLLALLGRRAR